MKNNTFFSILTAFLLALAFASCSSGGKQSSCAYYIYCSQDLLEFATPEITYQTSTGVEKTVLLDEVASRGEFVNGLVRKATENVVVGEDTMKLTRFYINVLATSWTHTFEATVKFIPNESAEYHDALLYHCLNADYKVFKTTNGYEESGNYFSAAQPQEIKSFDKLRVPESAVASYIKALADKPDYFSISITNGVFGDVVTTKAE
ncbi:MAG: hypothetical protein IJ756_07935 [Paludibacteraceae bacterium]|nr:hypothetical protein [Paludibacteraceae bacterium]MBR1787067.1 hypothetical protein [Paludibacteraceae bacterium]